MDKEIIIMLNGLLDNAVVASLLGALVGGGITGVVTSRNLAKQLQNDEKNRRKDRIGKIITALVSIKVEIKENHRNLEGFITKNKITGGSVGLRNKEEMFEFSKANSNIDIIELNLQSDLTEKISKLNYSINNMYKISDLKYEKVKEVIDEMIKLIGILESEIKNQREKLKELDEK